MNIKKFLIISCLAIQFSTIIHASQANFNAAFLKFGGGSNLATAAANIKPAITGWKAADMIAVGLKTNEALIVAKYVAGQTLNSTDSTNLNNALAVAKGGTAQLSDATPANWAAAFAAFGGVLAVQAKTAPTTMPSTITSTSASYGDAQVIVQYLTGATNMAAADLANLQAAFIATPLSDATPANWTAAFAVFGTAAAISAKTTTIKTIPTNTTPTGDMQVIVQFLNGYAMNATDVSNLNAALTAAGANGSASGSGSNSGPTANQTAGAALQQAIEAAKLVFNQYVGSNVYTPVTPIAITSLPA